jgi:uncharacterized protein (UPF0262 family)
LIAIRIEESAWSSATPERRREWTRLSNELLAQQPADDQQEIQLVVSPPLAGSFRIEIETPEGYPLREIVLPLKTILPHIEEYADICDQLAGLVEGSSSARLEALDMGKRVVHDRAAKTLLEHCGSLLPDETTARNFFSLLISLHLDTTKMLQGMPVWSGS